MQNVLVDDRRIWVDLYAPITFIHPWYANINIPIAHNPSHASTMEDGPTTPSSVPAKGVA